MKNILTTPALRRRAIYLIVGIVGLVATGLGKFTATEADSWAATAMQFYDQISPVVSAIALALAAKKATPSADDPTTVEDVEAARLDARAEAKREVLDDFKQLAERAAGQVAADAAAHAGAVLSTYRGPTSRG